MAIMRIELRDPYAPIGSSWSRTKAGQEKLELVEKGAWLIVTDRSQPARPQRYRIPISNVIGITEEDVIEGTK